MLKKLFCKHKYKFERNETLMINGGIEKLTHSVWKCKKCNHIIWKELISEDYINDIINKLDTNIISDGYHTFGELYQHRMILFSIICNQNQEISWKSKLHSDGTMFNNYFIVGLTTPEEDYTYHYSINDWDKFQVKELENAPEWDGHKPEDIERLYSILKGENKC